MSGNSITVSIVVFAVATFDDRVILIDHDETELRSLRRCDARAIPPLCGGGAKGVAVVVVVVVVVGIVTSTIVSTIANTDVDAIVVVFGLLPFRSICARRELNNP